MACCLALAWGCTAPERIVDVDQPIEFDHEKHASYFLDGKHREEKIRFHVEEIGLGEAPEELQQGRCLECHELDDRPACAGCHTIFQDEAARKSGELRPCLGCHRNAWTGAEASIPALVVCRSCHDASPLSSSPEEKILLDHIDEGRDIRWIRLNTLAEHVHFSHGSHVNAAGIPCTACHQDMSTRQEPPDLVSVFSMERCIDCHEDQGASTDCLTCHQ